MIRRPLLALALLLASSLSASNALAADDPRLGVQASKALAKGVPVRLFIAFAPNADDRRAKRGAADVAAELMAAAPKGRATLVRSFEHIDALAVHADSVAVQQWLRDPRVLRVDVDSGGHGGLDQSLPLAGFPPLQQAGADGAGSTIAVLDSGHSASHPALAGRVTAEYCYCSGDDGCCPGGGSVRSGAGAAADDHGHGTHVSSIAVGGNAPRGAAPAAELVSIKVLDSNNSFCCASDVLAGIDKVLASHPEVDVVNMSLGTAQMFPSICDGTTAWAIAGAQAVAALRERGTLVVAASLNGGSKTSMPMPACLSQVFSVGAVWDANLGTRSFSQNGFSCSEPTAADKLTCFSNTSALLDVVAPGAVVTAAAIGNGMTAFSGTSMAAPLVAGCAALLRQAHPQASSRDLADALRDSDTLVSDAGTGRSYPRLDCAQAMAYLDALAPSPEPDPVQVGTQYWLTGAGLLEGSVLHMELHSATGTAFGEDFDAAQVQRRRWGEMEIVFTGCDSAEMHWTSSGADTAGFGDGGYALQRLAPSEASLACQQSGFADVEGVQWVAGSWFGGEERSGEGLFLDVLANGVVVLAFFTHRPVGFE